MTSETKTESGDVEMISSKTRTCKNLVALCDTSTRTRITCLKDFKILKNFKNFEEKKKLKFLTDVRERERERERRTHKDG